MKILCGVLFTLLILSLFREETEPKQCEIVPPCTELASFEEGHIIDKCYIEQD